MVGEDAVGEDALYISLFRMSVVEVAPLRVPSYLDIQQLHYSFSIVGTLWGRCTDTVS